MADDLLLELSAVGHTYGDGNAGLDDCSLSIRRGSRNALLGANGSGKTTLLLHLNGLLRPTAGSIRLDGEALDYSRDGLTALRRRVGLVFQNPDRQLFSANVFEDVSFGPLNLGLDDSSVRERVAQALLAVGMHEHADRAVQHLSFGQKKRVCIAGVLAMQPELLLLDEPMAGLDANMQRDLLVVLEGLSARGITIVVATHDVDFAYRWADAVHLLAAGRCTASFAARQLPQEEAALLAAGQSLPAVVEVHRLLALRGMAPAHPVPHCMQELLSLLAASAHEESAMETPLFSPVGRRSAA